MNVTPVQNNNFQSFGMSLKLKGDGAKKLATALEEVSSDYASRFEKNVLDKIHNSKTKVIYDGENVIIHAKSKDISDTLDFKKPITELLVSDDAPIKKRNTSRKILKYNAKEGNAEYTFEIPYDIPQSFSNYAEAFIVGKPLMQKFFNAKEILKVLDANAAKRVYEAEQTAVKKARIEEKTKKLLKLYS